MEVFNMRAQEDRRGGWGNCLAVPAMATRHGSSETSISGFVSCGATDMTDLLWVCLFPALSHDTCSESSEILV